MTAPAYPAMAPAPLTCLDGYPPLEDHPSTGSFLGNYPQACSHVGVVSSGMNLARRLRGSS